MTWMALAADRLCELKADGGYDFDAAWSMAIIGVGVPARDSYQPTLFGGDGTLVGFFRQACEDAWYDRVDEVGSGNGPRLRYFRCGMLDDVQLEPVGMAA
jgi:hypothetical protein